MAVPLRQAMRVGATWPGNGCAATRSSRWCSSSSRCTNATWPARAAARSSTRTRSCSAGSRCSSASTPSRNARRRWCRSPGGEPLVHKEIDQIVAALVARKRYVYLCTNALLLEKKLRSLHAVAVLLVLDPHRRPARAPRRVGLPRPACSTRRSPPSRQPRQRGFRVTTNTTFFDQDDAAVDPRRARLPQRRGAGRQHADLARATPTRRRPTRTTGSTSSAPTRSSATRSPTAVARSGGSTTRRSSSTSSRARSTSAAPPGASRATRCSAGSVPATSCPTATPRRTTSCSRPPSGRSTAAAATSAAATAWRTAATSRPPWSPRPRRCASRCARRATASVRAEPSRT